MSIFLGSIASFHSRSFDFSGDAMGKGPGLYSDIGKRARDLLFMHSHSRSNQKFAIATYSPTDFDGCLFSADMNAQLKHRNITTDLNLDSSFKLLSTITVDDVCPGLRTVFAFKVPDPTSVKLELQYFRDFAGITSSIGLTPNPTLDFSTTLGNDNLTVGSEISFDTNEGAFSKYSIGATFTVPYLVASLTLNDKFDKLRVSCYHMVGPLANTAVGAEVAHCFSREEETITVGVERALNPTTTVSARINNFGKARVATRHEWRPVSIINFSAEVDAKSIVESTKFGLALALK